MSAPLAYFISWTTKGSWLPGDQRGWVTKRESGLQSPDRARLEQSYNRLKNAPITLSIPHRKLVTSTIVQHCVVRNWTLHALNARTNHVHVVVTASDCRPETVMAQFKSWCSRRLNEAGDVSTKWWTPHGSTRWINDEGSLAAAIEYVANRQ